MLRILIGCNPGGWADRSMQRYFDILPDWRKKDFSCWLSYYPKVGFYWFRPQRSRLVSEVKLDHHLCLQLMLLGTCVQQKCLPKSDRSSSVCIPEAILISSIKNITSGLASVIRLLSVVYNHPTRSILQVTDQ